MEYPTTVIIREKIPVLEGRPHRSTNKQQLAAAVPLEEESGLIARLLTVWDPTTVLRPRCRQT